MHADHEHLARAEHELQQDPKRADLQARVRAAQHKLERDERQKRSLKREERVVGELFVLASTN